MGGSYRALSDLLDVISYHITSYPLHDVTQASVGGCDAEGWCLYSLRISLNLSRCHYPSPWPSHSNNWRPLSLSQSQSQSLLLFLFLLILLLVLLLLFLWQLILSSQFVIDLWGLASLMWPRYPFGGLYCHHKDDCCSHLCWNVSPMVCLHPGVGLHRKHDSLHDEQIVHLRLAASALNLDTRHQLCTTIQ